MISKDKNRYRVWISYVSGIALTSFLFIAALGPGIYTNDPSVWYTSWQRYLFLSLCHQMPDRSFYINGVQMAVCTRCFGIYSGLWTGSIIFPLLVILRKRSFSGGKFLLILSFSVILIDFIGNLSGLWVNTNISRYVTGIFLGIAVTYYLSDEVFSSLKKQKSKLEGFAWNH